MAVISPVVCLTGMESSGEEGRKLNFRAMTNTNTLNKTPPSTPTERKLVLILRLCRCGVASR